MQSQLLLIPEAVDRSDGPLTRAAWAIDDETREIGLRGVAEARAILRAKRRGGADPRPASAQSAA